MTATEVQNTLFVQSPGSHVSLEGGSIRCFTADDDIWRRLPLARVDALILIGRVSASSELLLYCADQGIPVHWLSEFGRHRAVVFGPHDSGGGIRAAQYEAHLDSGRRTSIAASIVDAKIGNMLAVLRTAAHDATGHNKQALREGIDRIVDTRAAFRASAQDGSATRQTVLGFEGATSRFYFTAVRHTLRPVDGIQVPRRRTRRPATDPFNATLSFCYGLTRSAVHGAVHAAGLDPAIGFLHGDRDSQPSLVLDLMEELRPVADRLAVRMFNLKQLRPSHFATQVSGAVQLNETGRRVLLAAWHEHRQKTTEHRVLRRQIPRAVVPLIQARLLARFLIGDCAAYPAFKA